jgi:hypothetical protein
MENQTRLTLISEIVSDCLVRPTLQSRILAELAAKALPKLAEVRLGAQHRHDVSGMSPGLFAVMLSLSGAADVAITIIQRQQLQ